MQRIKYFKLSHFRPSLFKSNILILIKKVSLHNPATHFNGLNKYDITHTFLSFSLAVLFGVVMTLY